MKMQSSKTLFKCFSLQGIDFIDRIKPGPIMGKLIKYAYQVQINEGIKDKELLKKRALASLTKK